MTTTNTPEPRNALAILDELRAAIESAQQAPETLIVAANADMPALIAADNVLFDRAIRRAQYDALRKMLDVLDGWIEGAQVNHDALSHRDRFETCCGMFYPQDIRRMVNDAAREVGTREPYRENDSAAS